MNQLSKNSYKVQAWVVMIVTYLLGVTAMITQYKIPPVMKPLLESFGGNLVDGGLLMSIFSIVGIIFAAPSGAILIKIGMKKGAYLSLLLILIGSLIGTFTDNYSLMLLSRFIEGIGAILVAVVGPAIIALWFPPEKRGLPMGIWSTWVGVSVLISFNIAAPVTNLLGLKGMWWFNNVLSIVVLILFAILVKMPPEDHVSEGAAAPARFKDSIGYRNIWVLAVMFLLFTISVASYNAFAPTYVADTFQLERAVANSYTSIFSITMIIGAFVFGFIIQKVRSLEKMLIVVCLILAVVFSYIYAIPSMSVMVVSMLLIGFFFSSFPPMMFTLAPVAIPKRELVGAAMAFIMLGQKAGATLGPIIVSYAVEKAGGTWSAAIIPNIIVGVILFICSIVFYVWRKQETTSTSGIEGIYTNTSKSL